MTAGASTRHQTVRFGGAALITSKRINTPEPARVICRDCGEHGSWLAWVNREGNHGVASLACVRCGQTVRFKVGGTLDVPTDGLEVEAEPGPIDVGSIVRLRSRHFFGCRGVVAGFCSPDGTPVSKQGAKCVLVKEAGVARAFALRDIEPDLDTYERAPADPRGSESNPGATS